MDIKAHNSSPAVHSDRIIRAAELAHVIGVGKTATYGIVKRPDFPRAVQITETLRGWLLSEVLDWLKARRTN